MAGNLAKRVAFAVVAIPVALAVIWYGGLVLAVLLAAAGWLGTGELLHFAHRQQVRPWGALARLTAAAIPLLAWGVMSDEGTRGVVTAVWPFAAAIWLVVLLTGMLAWRGPGDRPLAAAAITLLAPAYAAGLPAFLLVLRHGRFPERSLPGLALAMFPLVTVWICDSVAMMVGKRVGGPRMAPTVSPNKTWSGTIGGFLGALAVAPAYHALVLQPLAVEVTPWQALAVAALVGSMGQVGDLAESLFKREVGLKDSSHLIPGHGGVLDRLDSLYFAIPLSAALLRFFHVL